MSSLFHHLQWWLSDHPTISTFHWSPTQTRFSSFPFLLSTIFFYLSFSLLLPLLPLPRPSSSLLRLFSSFHNLLLLLLSLAMSLGCSFSSFLHSPSLPLRTLFCFPIHSTQPKGPIFFWAYVFYLSKIYEFVDTLLIILSGADAATRRLTFLHVYHHAGVVLMCYIWLATKQSLMALALVTNASVHVVMYGYYLSCSLGRRWPARWKKRVTELQIWQFVVSFGISVGFLWFHFRGGGCEGFKGWLFNAWFNASLLLLFLDFHGKAYDFGKNKKEQDKEKKCD